MKIKMKELLLFFIALFTVLSHSFYAYINNRIVVNSIYVILSFLPVIYCFLYKIKIPKGKRNKLIIIYFLYLISICLYALLGVKVSELASFLCRYVIFLPFMIFVFIGLKKQEERNRIFKYISDIMICIAGISLFFWIFGTTLHVLKPTGQIWAVWGNAYRDVYWGVYLEVPGRISLTNFTRNVGIFCEAPAYALFLSIGFGCDMLLSNVKSRKRGIIYILSLISTGTTTGLLMIAYVIVAKIWSNTTKTRRKNLFIRFCTFLIGSGAIAFVYIFAMSDSKMASVVLRRNDYINGFSTWIAHPFLGVGYMADIAGTYFTGYSNGITQILVSGGILLFSIYGLGYVLSLLYVIKTKNKEYTYWLIMSGMLFSISIIGYAYIALLLLASQYAIYLSNKGISYEERI